MSAKAMSNVKQNGLYPIVRRVRRSLLPVEPSPTPSETTETGMEKAQSERPMESPVGEESKRADKNEN